MFWRIVSLFSSHSPSFYLRHVPKTASHYYYYIYSYLFIIIHHSVCYSSCILAHTRRHHSTHATVHTSSSTHSGSIWVTKMPLLESKASTKTACVSTAPVFNKNSGNAKKEDSGWWALVHHNKGVSEAPVYVLGRLCVCANILIYYF